MNLFELQDYLETKIPLFDSPVVIEQRLEYPPPSFVSTLLVSKLESSSSEPSFKLGSSDRLKFGRFWSHIRPYALNGKLPQQIHERHMEIYKQKEYWKGRLATLIEEDDFNQEVAKTAKAGRLIRIEEGSGAAYFLVDNQNLPRYVVKPVDEDILCLNNSKFYGTIFNDHYFRVRDDIPLYRSAQTDLVAYRCSTLLNLNITPKAIIYIMTNLSFYDIDGRSQKEKLCSVQEYVSDSSDFYDVIQNWLTIEKSEVEIQKAVDQDDFEDANLFVWLTYDNDAHIGNFRCYVKERDEQGDPIYGLKKIDNGLSFPEKNSNLHNVLPLFPNGQKKLSLRIREKIAKIPLGEIASLLDEYEMSSCTDALVERVEILQLLAKREDLNIEAINFRMKLLQKEDGSALALSPLPQEELEKQFLTTTPDAPYDE